MFTSIQKLNGKCRYKLNDVQTSVLATYILYAFPANGKLIMYSLFSNKLWGDLRHTTILHATSLQYAYDMTKDHLHAYTSVVRMR